MRWRLQLLALSPLARVSKRLTADLPSRQRPCSSCVAAVNVFGQLSMAHAIACNMLVWWSLRHGGVTGSGHDRHRADGIGTVWSDLACVKLQRRHRGGALAPPRTSGFGRFGERSEAGPVPRPCAAVYG